MVRRMIIFSLLNLFILTDIFATNTSMYKIIIENRETAVCIELVTDSDKEIIIDSIDRLNSEKPRLMKMRITYLITVEYEDKCIKYKTDGIYLAYAENDLYIECDERLRKVIQSIDI